VSVTAHATQLILPSRGILGKDTLHSCPPSRVPTHPFRVLCLSARGNILEEENFLMVEFILSSKQILVTLAYIPVKSRVLQNLALTGFRVKQQGL
jgi:hypothetical protein